MSVVDLVFPALGKSLPVNHGYALYGAVSRVLGPESHQVDGVGLFSIGGQQTSPGQLQLMPRSCLRVRTPLDCLPGLLSLSGRQLEIDGHSIRLGVPRTMGLIPAASLSARLVTIKGFAEPEPFLAAVQRQLDVLNVKGKPAIPLRCRGPHEGKPIRRILRIKDKKVVGFALLITELSAEESILLQEQGIGGRRHMGCGLFLPMQRRSSQK